MGGFKGAAERYRQTLSDTPSDNYRDSDAANQPIQEEVIYRLDGRTQEKSANKVGDSVVNEPDHLEPKREPCPCGTPGCVLVPTGTVMFVEIRSKIAIGELVELQDGIVATPQLAEVLRGRAA